jgi:hypothetical protein
MKKARNGVAVTGQVLQDLAVEEVSKRLKS